LVLIPKTKNGAARNVALSDRAWEILIALADGEPDDALIFKFSKDSRDHAW
jgi:hypothetical protein